MRSLIPLRGDGCVAIVLACVLVLQAVPIQAQESAPGAGKLNLVIVEGDGAINNAKQRVAREPIVQVEDENHKPVAGAAVTFFLPNSGASGTFANGSRTLTLLTDQNGRVVARGIKLNQVSGKMEIRVSASFQGKTGSALITQTNGVAAAVGAGAGAGISLKLIAIIAVAATAAAIGAVAATSGGGGNTPAGAGTSPTVITPGTPTVGGPR